MPYALRRPRLWYERSGEGEPLLLITGFTISSAVFDPVLELYEPRFDCIRYDNHGSGRSDSPLWPTSMPEQAHDAVRLLDALGIPSAHVYGVSMGGMIAQELAIRHPERVRGLVLGAAATKALSQPGRPWLGAMLFSPEFRRDQPERTASCWGTSPHTARGLGGSRRTAGRRSITTPCRAWARSRHRPW
jgi:3-oxoadipate enol-lactonase